MKGFKDKSGKFRPTGNKTKSTLKKTDVRKKQTVGVNEVNKLVRTKGTVEEFNKRQRDEKLERQYDYFLQGMNNFGTGDIASAVNKADEVNIGGKELSDLVREFSDDTETPLEDVDINAVLYEHILSPASGMIETATGYNPQDEGFYVAGNFMATSYDYSTQNQDDLQEAINKLSDNDKKRLNENKWVHNFLEDVDVTI